MQQPSPFTTIADATIALTRVNLQSQQLSFKQNNINKVEKTRVTIEKLAR